MLHQDRKKNARMLDFINRSFRDVADQDYIAARALYRLDLKLQFLWASLQSVEKYLKSILLFNACTAKGYGHRLEDLYADLPKKITDIPFDFPVDLHGFIKYLARFGENRYFEWSYYMTGEELFALDKTVWHVRRYSQYLRHKGNFNGKQIDSFPHEVKRVQDAITRPPHKFKISGGHIERVLSRKSKDPQRRALIWNNVWFGPRARNVLGAFTFHSGSANPAHTMKPDVFSELDKIVDFSRRVRTAYINHLVQHPRSRKST